MTTPRPTREETSRYLEDFSRLAEEMKRQDLARPLEPLVARFHAGLFRLVVVGEIKKGKTSFINALLGLEDLLPVASDVATSTVYKIYYGPQRAIKVFFRVSESENGEPQAAPDPLAITPGELAAYGTEDGNPDNVRNVDFIAVEAPHPLLKSGLAIIDTPGLGGLFRKHADITWRYIPNADAVFFTLDSVEAVMSRDETEFLKKLRGFTERLFFIQTKIDAAEEAQWKGWAERNQRIIAVTLGTPVGRHPYFPVSAQLKLAADKKLSPRHLQHSGFMPLLDFIHNRLMPSKDALLGRDVLRGVATAAGVLRAETEARRTIAQADTREKFLALEMELNEAKTKLAVWSQEQWPHALERFQQGLSDIQQRFSTRLAEELDSSPLGPIVSDIIEALRQDESITAEAINNNVQELQSQCLDRCNQAIFNMHENACGDIKSLTEQIFSELMTVEEPALDSEARIAGASVAFKNDLQMQFSLFDDAKTTVYGGIAGGTVAGVAVGLFAMAFPPVAALFTAASIVGALFGSYKAADAKSFQQKRDALGQLQQILQVIVQKSHHHAMRQFGEMTTVFRQKVMDTGRETAGGIRRSVDERMAELQVARQRNGAENKEVAAKIGQRLQVIDALLKGISFACPAPAAGVAASA